MQIYRDPVAKAAQLDQDRLQAVQEVNRIIGDVRLKYITDIPGQSVTYAGKEAEAKEYLLAIPEPISLENYPFIAQEADAVNMTPYLTAQMFSNLAAQWRYVGSILEGLRRGAIVEIEVAEFSEIHPIFVNLETALQPY